MALTWSDFNNGDTNLSIRNKLNTFNGAVKTNIDTIEGRVTANDLDILSLEQDVATLGSIDVTNGINYLDFKPQLSEPTYQHGRMYYDDAEDVFEAYTDFPDAPYYIGRSNHLICYNGTASTITKGTPVYMVGAQSGVVSVEPANSATVAHAQVIGLAQMDITSGSQGMLVTKGILECDTTTANTTGSVTYLGNSGGFSSTAGTFPVSLGVALDNVVAGHFLVDINTTAQLPIQAGILQFINPITSGVIPLTNTPQNIANYNTTISTGLVVDGTAGNILVPNTGVYRVNLMASMYWTADNATRNITFNLVRTRAGTPETVMGAPWDLPKGSDRDTRSMEMAIEIQAGDVFHVEVFTDTGAFNLSVSLIAFEIIATNLQV